MSKKMRVVVTGAQGDIAIAIVQRLRASGFIVDALQRGDDVKEAVRSADVVVVLDNTKPGGTDYRLALDAVGQSLEGTDVKRVVSVTLIPPTGKNRRSFLAQAKAAEADLARAGCPLTVIRTGFVVASPGQPAPTDDALFAKGKRPLMPGHGDQQVRPLLLDDLAKVVIAAVKAEPTPVRQKVKAEGPEKFDVQNLLRLLNPGANPRPQRPDWRMAVTMGVVIVILPLFVLTPWIFGNYWFLVAFMVAAVAGMATYSSYTLGVTRMTLLPDTTLLLHRRSPQALLGVELTNVSTVWNEFALKGRQRARGRSTRRYAATPGSYWIAGFLMLVGSAAIVVGLHDVVVSLAGLGSRLAGLTLTAAGCVMFFGGSALLTPWRSRYALGFLGSAVCAVTVVVILTTALLSTDPPWWTLLGGAYVVFVPIWCSASLWRRGGLVVADFMATRGQKVLGSVILGGTLLALVQALYSSAYVPSTLTPSISGDAEITRVEDAISANIRLQNPSDHAVTVLDAFYVVQAHRAAPVLDANFNRGLLGASEPERDRPTPPEKPNAVIDLGRLLAPGSSLQGGQEIKTHFVIDVPPGYPIVSVRVDLALARSRYRRQEYLTSTVPLSGVEHSVAEIDDPSWLHSLTRSPRYVHVLHAIGGELGCRPPIVSVAYVDDRTDTDAMRWCQRPTRIDEHYGVTLEQFYAESWVRAPQQSPRSEAVPGGEDR